MTKHADTQTEGENARLLADSARAAQIAHANTTAIYWHFKAFLPRMRTLPPAHQQTVGQLASELCLREPVLMTRKEFAVAPFGEVLTGAQVVALLVTALWTLCGENTNAATGLLTHWPDLPLYALLCEG